MMYNALVEQLFFQPEHAGINDLTDTSHTIRIADSTNQQVMVFYLVFQPDGRMAGIRYLAKGSPFWFAGAEWMARSVEKNRNGAILKSMTPLFWTELLAMPKTELKTAISLTQAATTLSAFIANYHQS